MSACRPQVVPNYGMRPVGGFGVRGFRMYCGTCDTLGPLYRGKRSAETYAEQHRRGHTVTPRQSSLVEPFAA